MGNSLAVAGLVADIFGVGFIGYAFLRSDSRTLYEQANTTWDYNSKALTALCEQKVDNTFGFGFLLAGFILQLLSALHVEPGSQWDFAALVAVLIAFVAAIFFRSRAVRRYETKAKAVAPSE
jgi:hypothetical protein